MIEVSFRSTTFVSRMLTCVLLQAYLFATVDSRVALAESERRPNIVFLLADDLGYGDLSCYGHKRFTTPNIDRIAAEGMRFTSNYSGAPVCAPSRCVLMTGKHSGHAFIRENRQYRPPAEGQWPVPEGELKLPLTLKSLGYTNGAFGKWGLGAPDSTGEPLKQGIDRFYGYNCQGVAHNYYPTGLWDNQTQVPLDNPKFAAHQKLPEGADPNNPDSYVAFRGNQFAPDLISEQALKFLRDNQHRPFLLYYPTTVPHLALQVPEDSLKEFEGKFPEEPYPGGHGYLPHRTPRAAYAAMVTRMDRSIGRILSLLKELQLEENTIVVFSSDNGPLYDKLGGTDCDFFESARDFRGRKGSVYEGGIRVPCLVRWPGRIAAGSTSDRVIGFEDMLPTLLELVGARDKTPTGIDGISFAPTLLGKEQPTRPFLYRETPGYGGQQSIRVGDWKLVRQKLNPPGKAAPKPTPPELYNLASDPVESKNVADANPAIVEQLGKLMREQHVASDLWPIRAIDAH